MSRRLFLLSSRLLGEDGVRRVIVARTLITISDKRDHRQKTQIRKEEKTKEKKKKTTKKTKTITKMMMTVLRKGPKLSSFENLKLESRGSR